MAYGITPHFSTSWSERKSKTDITLSCLRTFLPSSVMSDRLSQLNAGSLHGFNLLRTPKHSPLTNVATSVLRWPATNIAKVSDAFDMDPLRNADTHVVTHRGCLCKCIAFMIFKMAQNCFDKLFKSSLSFVIMIAAGHQNECVIRYHIGKHGCIIRRTICYTSDNAT